VRSIPSRLEASERLLLSRAFARVDPLAMGAAVGIVSGVGLSVATAVLLLQGGFLVGFHLGRLSFYLPGYSVTWPGVLVGLLEGGVAGAALGMVLAWLWNAYHRLFVTLVVSRERSRELRQELQQL
jgi:hypothetical protein